MKPPKMLFLIWLLFIGLTVSQAYADEQKTETIPPLPIPGTVTMVDLGAHKCIPCKMMAPIIEELQKEYSGRAAIIFIDVWKHRDQAKRFGIRAIPTQIFYDKDGKEAARHLGFMDKKSIVAQFEKLGVPKESRQ